MRSSQHIHVAADNMPIVGSPGSTYNLTIPPPFVRPTRLVMLTYRLPLSFLLFVLPLALGQAQEKPTKYPPGFPGPTDIGFVLPNGWRLSPAGRQVLLTDLPLNVRSTPD